MHIDEFVANHLARDQGPPEGFTLTRIVDGEIECSLRSPIGLNREVEPLGNELLHDEVEAAVFFPNKIAGWNSHVFEIQFGRVRAVPAHLA